MLARAGSSGEGGGERPSETRASGREGGGERPSEARASSGEGGGERLSKTRTSGGEDLRWNMEGPATVGLCQTTLVCGYQMSAIKPHREEALDEKEASEVEAAGVAAAITKHAS